jgi:hypothetical protein
MRLMGLSMDPNITLRIPTTKVSINKRNLLTDREKKEAIFSKV